MRVSERLEGTACFCGKMSRPAMMAAGARTVFCYGQRVENQRIGFRPALPLPSGGRLPYSQPRLRLVGRRRMLLLRMEAYSGHLWQLRRRLARRASFSTTYSRRGRAARGRSRRFRLCGISVEPSQPPSSQQTNTCAKTGHACVRLRSDSRIRAIKHRAAVLRCRFAELFRLVQMAKAKT